jgi:hypothetical protein
VEGLVPIVDSKGFMTPQQVLHNLLERCNIEVEGKLEHKTFNHLHTRRIRSREFKINASIEDLNIEDIILDLGSEVNIFPKKTW